MALREFDFEKEPTVSIVKKILTDAIKFKATDIHFDPTEDELNIRFRINGDLTEYTIVPDNIKVNILTRIKILGGMNITDSLLPQIGTINFELNNENHNMRVSSLPVMDGEKIVVHISNYAKNLKSIEKLGFNEMNTKKLKSLLKEKQGIILVTGTTNSGKTTTTYSILKEINSRLNNIISIENPVKMKIKGINQVEIAPEKGLTYRNVLNNILLQDPNIIAIDELIDDETARAALRASVSGRLIISTMNTKSAYNTIDTLLNMDVENYLLGSNLNGIVSQRMVKKLCPACRIKKKASEYERAIIKKVLGEDVKELYYPNGCEECQDGFVDLIPVEEVIKINNELKNAIANNRNRTLIRNIIYEENESILKNALRKAINGETSFGEVLRIINLKTDFTEDDRDLIDIILGNKRPNLNEEKESPKKIEEVKEIKEKIKETEKEPIKEETSEPAVKPLDLKEAPIIEKNNNENKENKIEPPKETKKEPIASPVREEKETSPYENKPAESSTTLIAPPSINNIPEPEPIKELKTIEVPEIKINTEEPKVVNDIKEVPLIKPNAPLPTEVPIIETNNTVNNDDDDDDDDDDFNYDDSYVNNF